MSEVKYEGREKREKLYLKVDFEMKTRNVERIPLVQWFVWKSEGGRGMLVHS